MPVQTLDCTLLRCPLPIVRISQVVKDMAVGDRLLIQASDLAFRADLEAWLRRLGHQLVESQDGPVQRAVIEKRGLGVNAGKLRPWTGFIRFPLPQRPRRRRCLCHREAALRFSLSAVTWINFWPFSPSLPALPPWACLLPCFSPFGDYWC